MAVSFEENFTEVSASAWRNAIFPRSVTVSGRVIEESAVQPSKARLPTV